MSGQQGATNPQEKQSRSTKDAQRKRILLVDDDPEIIESIRVVLEAEGYEIIIARDGNQGLVLADREDPDLIILDGMMPKRSGWLVLERLRLTRRVPVRIIMITAAEGKLHQRHAESFCVDGFIRKPFAMEELLEKVRELLK